MPTKLSDRFLGRMADAGYRSSLRQLDAIELHRTGGQDGASRVQGEELGESNGEPIGKFIRLVRDQRRYILARSGQRAGQLVHAAVE